MFRKRRRPTPHFKIPSPYNPIQGGHANLRQLGTHPFCAMMQVAAEDTYDDYVICRGFDTRILRFVDYEEGNADKPGISVAKPFGKRMAGTYGIAEIYPALLPTQGNSELADLWRTLFVPPSPTAVEWRVGQNPGTTATGLDNGQPDDLTDTINVLYDHNGKAINWLLIDSAGGSLRAIQGTLDSIATAGTGSSYNGKTVGTITVVVAPCNDSGLIGTQVDVVDWSGCIFDLDIEDMEGVWVWAGEGIAASLQSGADPGDLAPCHWTAWDRCCVSADTSVDGGTA